VQHEAQQEREEEPSARHASGGVLSARTPEQRGSSRPRRGRCRREGRAPTRVRPRRAAGASAACADRPRTRRVGRCRHSRRRIRPLRARGAPRRRAVCGASARVYGRRGRPRPGPARCEGLEVADAPRLLAHVQSTACTSGGAIAAVDPPPTGRIRALEFAPRAVRKADPDRSPTHAHPPYL
jgi:hypothetical protein